VVLATGLSYRSGEPVLIRVCRRDHRYDLTDEGAAVALAGRPAGFREIALRIVDQQGFNLNRRGVISVPAVAGRDIASLVLRLAEASRRVYLSLLG
jgi:hypothetical protein